jgi:hypothetical protein
MKIQRREHTGILDVLYSSFSTSTGTSNNKIGLRWYPQLQNKRNTLIYLIYYTNAHIEHTQHINKEYK